jgi:hypothetical protein
LSGIALWADAAPSENTDGSSSLGRPHGASSSGSRVPDITVGNTSASASGIRLNSQTALDPQHGISGCDRSLMILLKSALVTIRICIKNDDIC